jgi:hypothetical protein
VDRGDRVPREVTATREPAGLVQDLQRLAAARPVQRHAGVLGVGGLPAVEVEEGQRGPVDRVVARGTEPGRGELPRVPVAARGGQDRRHLGDDRLRSAARDGDGLVEAQRPGQCHGEAAPQVGASVVGGRQDVVGDAQERDLLVVRPGGAGQLGRFQRGSDARVDTGQRDGPVVLHGDLRGADGRARRTGVGQRRSEVAVQSQPPRRVEPVVDGPADQGVGEGVAIGRRVRRDEPRGQHVVQRRECLGVREPGGRADRLVEERALDPRRGVEQPVRGRGQAATAAGDDLPHALWHHSERQHGAQSSVGARGEPSVLAEVGHDLTGEERVAVGLGPHRGHEVGRERSTRGRGHQLLDRPPVEPDQPEHAALRLAAQRAQRVGERVGLLARPVRPDDEEPSPRRVARDVPQHGHGAVVGPVQVVHGQHDGCDRRPVDEEAGDAVEQP